MIDIQAYIKSIKLTLYRRLIKGECDWESLFSTICQCDVEKLVKFGDEYPKVCARKTSNPFWREMLTILHEFIKIVENKNLSIFNKNLLFNSHLHIDKKPLHYKIFVNKNILFVYDMLNQDGSLLTFENFKTKFDIDISFIHYIGLRNSLFKTWPSLKDGAIRYTLPCIPTYIKILLQDNKGSRSLYNILIDSIKYKSNYQQKWEGELNTSDINWKKLNLNIFTGTGNKYLQWFQYRITHRSLGANKVYML